MRRVFPTLQSVSKELRSHVLKGPVRPIPEPPSVLLVFRLDLEDCYGTNPQTVQCDRHCDDQEVEFSDSTPLTSATHWISCPIQEYSHNQRCGIPQSCSNNSQISERSARRNHPEMRKRAQQCTATLPENENHACQVSWTEMLHCLHCLPCPRTSWWSPLDTDLFCRLPLPYQLLQSNQLIQGDHNPSNQWTPHTFPRSGWVTPTVWGWWTPMDTTQIWWRNTWRSEYIILEPEPPMWMWYTVLRMWPAMMERRRGSCQASKNQTKWK